MVTILQIIITLASILLIFVVYIQNSKGGGLSSEFGGSSGQLGGIQKTAELIEKLTWGLAGIIVASSIIMAILVKKPPVENTQQGNNQSQQA